MANNAIHVKLGLWLGKGYHGFTSKWKALRESVHRLLTIRFYMF